MSDVMTRRVAAAQATLDAWKDRTFKWGEADCCRLVAYCLRELGYNPGLSRFGRYSTPAGAARAIRRRGFADTVDVIDGFGFVRIPPAAAVAADILGFRHPEMGELAGLGIALGNGRMLAFLADQICHVTSPNLQIDDVEYFGWKVPPCRS